jgi:hypothetical protein
MSDFNTKVPLLRLYSRTSAKGTEYLSGYIGLASVVAFMGEDHNGKPCWIVSVSEAKPREGSAAPRKRAVVKGSSSSVGDVLDSSPYAPGGFSGDSIKSWRVGG